MSRYDLHGADKEILAFADAAASELRVRFKDEPQAELFAWLDIALEREAMVGEAYSPANLQEHLDRLLTLDDVEPRVVELLRETIGQVWAQEEGHTAYIGSIATAMKQRPGFSERVRRQFVQIRGVLEGLITSRLMSPNVEEHALAIVAVSIGQQTGNIPPFVSKLRAQSFASFCAINAAFEQTAITGYRRMYELIMQLRDQHVLTGMRVDIDLARITSEEIFHEHVFGGFSGWDRESSDPPPNPTPGSPLDDPPFTVEAHAAILNKACMAAFGPRVSIAQAFEKMTVDREQLLRDPLIQYLQTYVRTFEHAPQSVKGEPAGV